MAGSGVGMKVGKSIPFCRPKFGDVERAYIERAMTGGRLEGGGEFNRACEQLLENQIGCARAMITPSCTAALEMMALMLDIQPGEEVIMPSFTFVSSANAIALRGGVPVFVDVDPATMNLDPAFAEAAITPKTRAIMTVHYAGVGCDMSAFTELCDQNDIVLLEDAAQAIGASWQGRALGSFGQMGAFSFHHTKNISCGEGGALTINDEAFAPIAEKVQDKGTDRADFRRGIQSKYEWLTLGSSFLLSELTAGVLLAQLESVEELTSRRLELWHTYDAAFRDRGDIRTPEIPLEAQHNGHIYHFRLPNRELRDALVAHCRGAGIIAPSHYVPLNDTVGGRKFGRASGSSQNTVECSETLIRMPIYNEMTSDEQDFVISHVSDFLDAQKLR